MQLAVAWLVICVVLSSLILGVIFKSHVAVYVSIVLPQCLCMIEIQLILCVCPAASEHLCWSCLHHWVRHLGRCC